MGQSKSKENNQKFYFLDKKDIQETGFVPVSQKTSLQPRYQRNSASYQGPSQGQQGEYTGLQQFIIPQKYSKIMKQNPLVCQKPNIKGNDIFDPYLFKKSLNVYYGEWCKGKPHGYGRIFNPDQDFYYEGYFQEGLPSYYGVFLTNNIQYRGEIKYGRADGKGKYVEGKVKIEGQFKQNNPYINCIQIGQNYIFKGSYKDGRWKKGNLIQLKQKKQYQGEFQNGLPHGEGLLKTASYVYKGYFRQGKKHGWGKIQWKNEAFIYEGQFLQDQMTGKGELQTFDKVIYRGNFVNGKANGQGFIVENQNMYKVLWKNGQAIQFL